jgi:hypothetical protein
MVIQRCIGEATPFSPTGKGAARKKALREEELVKDHELSRMTTKDHLSASTRHKKSKSRHLRRRRSMYLINNNWGVR